MEQNSICFCGKLCPRGKSTCGDKKCYNQFYAPLYKERMQEYKDSMLALRDQDELINWIRNGQNRYGIHFHEFKSYGIEPKYARQQYYDSAGSIVRIIFQHYELKRVFGDYFKLIEI